MLIYITYAFYVVYWRNHLAYFSGFPLLIMTGLFHYFTEQAPKSFETNLQKKSTNELIIQDFELTSNGILFKNRKHSEQDPSSMYLIRELRDKMKKIMTDRQQKVNLFVFIICNMGCYVSYFGVYLALNRLKGNIYVNSSVSTIFELTGGISAAMLTSRFNLKLILWYTYLLLGFSYLSCVLIDMVRDKLEGAGTLGILISLLPIIVSKATHEILFPIFIIYLPKILKHKYHQFAMASGNLAGVLTMNILPFYQYFMEEIEVNQFAGYGLFMIAVLTTIPKIIELDYNVKQVDQPLTTDQAIELQRN